MRRPVKLMTLSIERDDDESSSEDSTPKKPSVTVLPRLLELLLASLSVTFSCLATYDVCVC